MQEPDPYQKFYRRFEGSRLTLNDFLAIDRTILSNERSMLAYGRTALAIVALGGSCLKFFDERWVQTVGVIAIAGGVALAARGWWRYRLMKRTLAAALTRLTGTPEHPLGEEVAKAKEAEASVAATASSNSPAPASSQDSSALSSQASS